MYMHEFSKRNVDILFGAFGKCAVPEFLQYARQRLVYKCTYDVEEIIAN